MPCSNSPSTSALSSFLACSASRAYSHGLRPRPPKSRRAEAQVLREQCDIAGQCSFTKLSNFESGAGLTADLRNFFVNRARHLNAIEPPLCVPLSIGLFPECRGLVA